MFFYEYPTLSYHLKAVFYVIWCFLLCFLEIPFTIDCNVTDIEQINIFYQRAQELFSSVDIWINNAGVNQPDKAVYELTKNKIDFLIDIDLKGTIYGSSIAFKNMKKLGFGQIYNIEGYGSNDAMMLGLSIYGTSKRAVIYFKKL